MDSPALGALLRAYSMDPRAQFAEEAKGVESLDSQPLSNAATMTRFRSQAPTNAEWASASYNILSIYGRSRCSPRLRVTFVWRPVRVALPKAPMSSMPSSPSITLAGHFYSDATDFLARYELASDDFWPVRRRRAKLYTDLRMAHECVLKAVVVYSQDQGTPYEKLLEFVMRYGHNIGNLERAANPFIQDQLDLATQCFGGEMDALPVDLRYCAESTDLRFWSEELYYGTIGSDSWLSSVHEYVSTICVAMGRRLSSHSQVLHVSEIADAPPNRSTRLVRRVAEWLRSQRGEGG